MALEVIGAGLGRTGTMSLKLALERLGLTPCYHMHEIMAGGPGAAARAAQWDAITAGAPADWDALFEGYRATVDWPACNYWRELRARWPRAKVILSLRRDAEAWFRSCQATIMAPGLPRPPFIDRLFAAKVGPDTADRDRVIAAYEAHNAEVMAAVPADELLVMTPEDGWDRLCPFLGLPIPDEPYPATNSTADFRAMVAARLAAR